MTREIKPPEAQDDVPRTGFAPPTERVGARFIIPFALANLGYWTAFLTPPVVAMSVHLTTVLPPAERTGALSLVLGVGGIFNLIVSPLVGRLSDRTRSRMGMRKPWMIAGVVITAIGMTIVALSTSVPLILLGYCINAIGISTTIAALIALMPDHVPHAQRGRVSGILGLGNPIGAVGGALLAQALAGNAVLLFLVPVAVMAVGVGILVVSFTDRRLSPAEVAALPAFGLREFIGSYWVSPRRYPDFGWTWLSRFLVFMGVAAFTTYQAFFLIDRFDIQVEQVAGIIALAVGVQNVFVLASSPLAGWLSDRLDRRKVFIAAAALLYAIGMAVIAVAGTLGVFLVGMAVVGIGLGAYLAVDLALVTDVLPNPDEAAKEMGVFTLGNTLPPAVAPAIAPLLLAIPVLSLDEGGNYVALFIVSAVLAVLGALVIRPVRGAR